MYRSPCLQGTRVQVLRTLNSWARDPGAQQVYWLNGHAGSGKSTIAQSFAEQLFAYRLLGASFYCSRDSQQRSDLNLIFPTIAYQLATADHPAAPVFRQELLRVIAINPEIATASLKTQLQDLIVNPVKESGMSTVIIIDALDECRDDNTTSIILHFLDQNVARIPNIKFFITSRPEPHIRLGFRLDGLRLVSDVMILHEVTADSVDGDIRLYLKTRLTGIAAKRSNVELDHEWPEDHEIDELTKKAGGLFIFASTAVKFIDSKNHVPQDRLRTILTNAEGFKHEGSSGLDALYLHILKSSFSEEDDAFLSTLRSILGLLVVACDLLSIAVIGEFLDIHTNIVWTTLRSLHSVLVVPEDVTGIVRFHHKSFPDFLTDATRCKEEKFYIDRNHHHFESIKRCFEFMEKRLRKNICDLPRYSTNDSVAPEVLEHYVNDPTKYSCRYWAEHLLSNRDPARYFPATEPLLHEFLTVRQLQWFEVLALLKELWRAVDSLNGVRQWLSSVSQQVLILRPDRANSMYWQSKSMCGDKYQVLLESVTDGHKFILNAFDLANVSAAHLYHSFLPFAPEQSILKKSHMMDLDAEAKVILGLRKSWSGPIRTINLPNPVFALEYSRDATMLAAGGDGFSQLSRSGTGERLAKLDSALTRIQCLTFKSSHNDRLLATSSGNLIKIWEIGTGIRITELQEGHATIASIEFHSEFDHLLVSGDVDGRVSLWHIRHKQCKQLHTFAARGTRGQLCWLRRRAQKTVLIGAKNGGIQMWKLDPPKQIKVFTPSASVAGAVEAVACSRDGKWAASGSREGALLVYNVDTCETVYSLGISIHIRSLQFSPAELEPMAIAFTAGKVVHVFYPEHPTKRVISLEGHVRSVTTVAFSPDGRFIASGSDDCTINIWEPEPPDPGVENPSSDDFSNEPSDQVMFTRFSDDGQLIISGSEDKTVKVWDYTRDGSPCYILEGHSERLHDAFFLFNDEHVVSVDQGGTLMIWDWRQTRAHIQNTKMAMEYGSFVHVSPYGRAMGSSGFFSSHVRTETEVVEIKGVEELRTKTTRTLCYWVVNQRSTGHLALVLAAHGNLPGVDSEDIIRIDKADRLGTSDVTLHITCKSGMKLTASLPEGAAGSHAAALNIMVSSAIPRSRQSYPLPRQVGYNSHDSLDAYSVVAPVESHTIVGVNGHPDVYFRQSPDGHWLLNDNDQRILWLPPIHRGRARWNGKKLILEGESGRLTLIDFSDVDVSATGHRLVSQQPQFLSSIDTIDAI